MSEGPSFVRALLLASHAEALSGGTGDLITILGRDSKPRGFSHKDIRHECRIMWGELDDKISESSMRRLEKEMPRVQLTVLPGEGHNLMTSSSVMLAVMESLAADARKHRVRH
jgi:pimeloyl-ACP methyl ester carboxylesterase